MRRFARLDSITLSQTEPVTHVTGIDSARIRRLPIPLPFGVRSLDRPRHLRRCRRHYILTESPSRLSTCYDIAALSLWSWFLRIRRQSPSQTPEIRRVPSSLKRSYEALWRSPSPWVIFLFWPQYESLHESFLLILFGIRWCRYYTTRLWIGTPPQRFALIVDTGSTVTYVPCSTCEHCGRHQVKFFTLTLSLGILLIWLFPVVMNP